MRNLLEQLADPDALPRQRAAAEALHGAGLAYRAPHPADVGRPITDITWNLDVRRRSRSDVKEVLDDARLQGGGGCRATTASVYTMRIHPYRTIDDLIDGVVITFVDITAHAKRHAGGRPPTTAPKSSRGNGRPWPGIAYVEEVARGARWWSARRRKRVSDTRARAGECDGELLAKGPPAGERQGRGPTTEA